MSVTAIHLMIHGRVQGVGYRAWASGKARKAGLKGWVRNCREGTVEAVLIGEVTAVEQMVAACYEGPLAAKVTQIDCGEWDELSYTDFQQLPTV